MTTSAALELDLDGHDATVALGRLLGETFPGGGAPLLLSGELGAGKTTLVKGLAEGLGVAESDDVTSPTFLRVVRFDGDADGHGDGRPDLVHVDAYRMQGARDLEELGLDEELAGPACVALEWPEQVSDGLPEDALTVALGHADETRRIARLTAGGPRAALWLDALREARS